MVVLEPEKNQCVDFPIRCCIAVVVAAVVVPEPEKNLCVDFPVQAVVAAVVVVGCLVFPLHVAE